MGDRGELLLTCEIIHDSVDRSVETPTRVVVPAQHGRRKVPRTRCALRRSRADHCTPVRAKAVDQAFGIMELRISEYRYRASGITRKYGALFM